MTKNKLKERQYFVSGMHCAACELLIENKLLEKGNIKAVDVSMSDESVLLEFTGKPPSVGKLNKMFAQDNYLFSASKAQAKQADEQADQEKTASGLFKVNPEGDIIWNWYKIKDWLPTIIVVGIIFGAFLKFGNSGLAKFSVNSDSSVIAFFIFGIVAGLSTCSALVGGIILSMSKQWTALYQKTDSGLEKSEPHLLFNGGRIVAYGVIGLLLGALGNVFQVSLEFSALLTIGVSIVMFILALQMMGVRWAQKFQFKAPKSLTRNIANEKKFTGRYMPALMGAGTVFLPCGFTITVQGLALLSGNPITGALIMLAFVLGTTPILLMIGLSSLMFTKKPHLAKNFSRIASVLIILFAIFNINSAFNVLGIPNLSDLTQYETSENANPTNKIAGKQIIKMSATGSGYSPNYFKVKVGVPVEWQITDNGASGCTNAIIARDFFTGRVNLTRGGTVTKVFTPTKVGRHKFSCWMGMASGVIEVVK